MYRFFLLLSRFMATLGGIMLLLLICITVVSVIGRSLNGFLHSDFLTSFAPGIATKLLELGVGPVNGDYELIEAGIAFSIFAFIPLCQISQSHASVDIFTNKLSPGVNRFLRFCIDMVFALVLVIIAVQLYAGMQSKIRSGQTTLLIEFPIWWAYALSMFGAVAAALIGVYIAYVRSRELFTGSEILPTSSGAEH